MSTGPKPKPINVKKTVILGGLLIAFFLFTYTRNLRVPDNPTLTGHTMGTTYTVKLVGFEGKRKQLLELQTAIDKHLQEINLQMSTYLTESEISTFNQHTSTSPFRVSPDFAQVTRTALDLSQASGGGFDPTLDPLINLWGFGSGQARIDEPDPDQVEDLKKQCGYQLIQVVGEQQLRKSNPNVHLNLNAIAKGFGVDKIAELLTERNYEQYYVEIGGEVRVRGSNPENKPWRIGIDRPLHNGTPGQDLLHVVHLRDKAIATSGDYRNFFEGKNGFMYSHILDPRSGRPVTNRVASVSVIADTCTQADGLATTLMVLGPEKGMALVESRDGVSALFMLRSKDGVLRNKASEGFTGYLTP